jgi:hypothetical protein
VNGVVLWLLLGVARGSLGDSYASRYVYAGAVDVALAAVELAAGLRPGAQALPGIGAIAGLSIVLNIGWMIVWGNHLRDEATRARAELAALQIAGPRTPASFAPSSDFRSGLGESGELLRRLAEVRRLPGRQPRRAVARARERA